MQGTCEGTINAGYLYIIIPRLSASSQVIAWSRMSAGSKEDIMITSAQKNKSQISTGALIRENTVCPIVAC